MTTENSFKMNMSKQLAGIGQEKYLNIDNKKEVEFYHEGEAASNELEYYYNGNQLDEDIYDFSNTRSNMHFDAGFDNLTDDEEDINFDYEYGYDYERVIKDRLKKVNQEFTNDSEPPQRKSILVSFDQAVTVFVPKSENESEEGGKSPFLNEENIIELKRRAEMNQQQQSQHQQEENENHQISKEHSIDSPVEGENVSQLPLNDTILKVDPDAFANKIREAVARYDARINNNNNNINNIESEEKENLLEDETDYFRSTKFNRVLHESNSPNKNEFEEPKKKTPNSSVNTSPTLSKHTPSPPRSNRSSPEQQRQTKYVEFDRKSGSNSSSVKSEEILKAGEKRTSSPLLSPIQNFANNNSNQLTSSPILSSRSSPDASIIQENSKQTFSYAAPRIDSPKLEQPSKNKLNDSSDDSKSESLDKVQSYEKILVEKDGKFKLMSAEEYTAYEEQLRIEERLVEQRQEVAEKRKPSPTQPPPTSHTQQPTSNTKLISSQFVPHPPARPKTSNNGRTSIKARFMANENSSAADTTNTTNNTNNSLPSPKEQQAKRVSQSADPAGRRRTLNKSASPVRLFQTPDYAQGYKSPYQAVKIIKPIKETPEAKKLREKNEAERKRENELAFQAWFRNKEKQRSQEKKKNKTEAKTNSTTELHTLTTNNTQEDKYSFEVWLIKKRQQFEKEREFKKKVEQINLLDKHTVTPDDRSKAFKEWMNRKMREKNEAVKLEKLENKKWVAKRRRSRKHQKLFQAIEMAQVYGYNPYGYGH